MRIFFYFILLSLFLLFCTSLFAQQERAAAFFSRVPQITSNYSSPGNPCGNAIEFKVNAYDKDPVTLVGENYAKDSKGKAQVNYSKGGNKTVWYKLSFNTDCELTFRIYSDSAKDTYHYFVYLQDKDPAFCKKLNEKKIVPLRANLLNHKEGIIGTGIANGIKINYKDTSEDYLARILYDTPFLDGISAKAGETYYINIYHTEGTDAYHYLVLSACYKEINLMTRNDNASGEKAKIIDKLPEHVTKPPAEKTQAEKDSLAAIEKENAAKKKADAEAKKKAGSKEKAGAAAKKKTDADAAAKAKSDAAEKKIAAAAAKKKAAEEAAAKKKADAEAKKKAAEEAKLSKAKSASGGKKNSNPVPSNEKKGKKWSIDLADPAVYAEMLKKYGDISMEGLNFRVQVGAYRMADNFNDSVITELGKVEHQMLDDGIMRFVIGEQKTWKEADDFKQKVFQKGVKDAFILAFYKGERKYLEELIENKIFEKQ